MGSSSSDHEAAAVRAITKGYEISTRLHTMLREVVPRGDGRLETAYRLSRDVQQSLSTALSLLKPSSSSSSSCRRDDDRLTLEIGLACSGRAEEDTKPRTALFPAAGRQTSKKRDHVQSESTITYENFSDDNRCKGGCEKKNNKKIKVQRDHLNSWTTTTCAPFNDGHQWRKYGEKKISNTKMPRCYYRCTHKDDQGCLATKQVQQKDNESPPAFVVTYNKQHTCKNRNLVVQEQFVIEPMLQDPCQLTL